MICGFLLFFATLLFASVMGFAFGVFVAPAVDATHFRATVDAGVLAISRPVLSVLEKFKVTPAKVPPAAAQRKFLGRRRPRKERRLPRRPARAHRFSPKATPVPAACPPPARRRQSAGPKMSPNRAIRRRSPRAVIRRPR